MTIKDELETYGAVGIHLWAADEDICETPTNPASVISREEPFIAGAASCRLGVESTNELYADIKTRRNLHPNRDLQVTEWGTREFGVLDLVGNLITFFERVVLKR